MRRTLVLFATAIEVLGVILPPRLTSAADCGTVFHSTTASDQESEKQRNECLGPLLNEIGASDVQGNQQSTQVGVRWSVPQAGQTVTVVTRTGGFLLGSSVTFKFKQYDISRDGAVIKTIADLNATSLTDTVPTPSSGQTVSHTYNVRATYEQDGAPYPQATNISGIQTSRSVTITDQATADTTHPITSTVTDLAPFLSSPQYTFSEKNLSLNLAWTQPKAGMPNGAAEHPPYEIRFLETGTINTATSNTIGSSSSTAKQISQSATVGIVIEPGQTKSYTVYIQANWRTGFAGLPLNYAPEDGQSNSYVISLTADKDGKIKEGSTPTPGKAPDRTSVERGDATPAVFAQCDSGTNACNKIEAPVLIKQMIQSLCCLLSQFVASLEDALGRIGETVGKNLMNNT